MTRRASIVSCATLLLSIAVSTPLAVAQDASLTEPSIVPSPLTIVPPAFPSSKVGAKEVKVKVNLEGTVTPDGAFELGRADQSEEGTVFVDAAKDSIKWWRFVPATDNSACVPKAQEVRITVWFEGTSEDPHIYLSLPKAPVAVSEPVPRFASIDTPTTRFPPKLYDIDGQVQVLMSIDAHGDVTSASILSSTPYGAFDAVTLASARRTHVVWKEGRAPVGDAKLCMVRPYRFCSTSASGDVVSRPAACRH